MFYDAFFSFSADFDKSTQMAGSEKMATIIQVISPSTANRPKLTKAWLPESSKELKPIIVVEEQRTTAPIISEHCEAVS